MPNPGDPSYPTADRFVSVTEPLLTSSSLKRLSTAHSLGTPKRVWTSGLVVWTGVLLFSASLVTLSVLLYTSSLKRLEPSEWYLYRRSLNWAVPSFIQQTLLIALFDSVDDTDSDSDRVHSGTSSPHVYESPWIDLNRPLHQPYSSSRAHQKTPSSDMSSVKAAVVILAGNQNHDLIDLSHALLTFHQYVNLALCVDYPALVVFVRNEWTDVQQQLIQHLTQDLAYHTDKLPPSSCPQFQQSSRPLRLQFVEHEFALPANFTVHPDAFHWKKRDAYGYQHMCRFWFRYVFQLPEVRALDYYMRLDTDSTIDSPLLVDPFVYMQIHKFDYAYLQVSVETWFVQRKLFAHTVKYISDHTSPDLFASNQSHKSGFRSFFLPDASTLKLIERYELDLSPPKSFSLPHVPLFYNNFEVAHIAWFVEHSGVQEWMRVTDENELFGLLNFRWGDAPLRFLTLAMYDTDERVVMMKLDYSHSGNRVAARPVSFLQRQPITP